MTHRNPAPTVDVIVELVDRAERPVVLIQRLNPPHGWALPGGFIDYGESAETAAVREAKEETGLDVQLLEQFHVYSAPDRDPRKHTLSIVFLATARGTPQASDDAKDAVARCLWELPTKLCFDHGQILHEYWYYRQYGRRPTLSS